MDQDVLPRWFGDYELLHVLGSGGMAEVYLARHVGAQGFEKPVVVKVMHPRLAKQARFIEMFIKEAKVSVRLQHPNIVQVLRLEEHEGISFIVMEHVHGRDLFTVLSEAYADGAALPIDFAVHCITEMLKGLGYAHDAPGADGKPAQLVHRDVTPSNVFISFEGEVKLGDFGVAHQAGEGSRRMRGKFGYLAPEALGGRGIDQRADLFSAGVVLWEALTQRRLFVGKDDSETISNVRDTVPVAPSTINPRIPPDLDGLVARALEKDPSARFQAANEFEEALADFLYARRLRWTRKRIADVMQARYPEQSRPLVLPAASSRGEEDFSYDAFDDVSTQVFSAIDMEDQPTDPGGFTPMETSPWPDSIESSRISAESIDALVYAQAAERAQKEQLLVYLRGYDEPGAWTVEELVRQLVKSPQDVQGVGVVGETRIDREELGRLVYWDSLLDFKEPDAPPVTQSGLDQVSITKLVYELTVRRMSGLVVFEDAKGSSRRHLYLESGLPVYIGSDNPTDGTLAVILRNKLLEPSTVYRAMRQVVGDHMPIDSALASVAGPKGQAQVERVFSAIIRGRLYAAFPWTDGSFRIYPKVKPPLHLTTRVPSLLGILVRAVRTSFTSDQVRALLRMRGDLAVVLSESREAFVKTLRLKPFERAALEAIDGLRNVGGILEATGAQQPEQQRAVLAMLYVLAETGLAELF